MSRTYRHPKPPVDIPSLDLLTLMFDSEYCNAQDDTVVHLEAAHPSNKITKAQLRELTQQIASGLRHSYGIGANGPNQDVVTVFSYGQPMVPAALYGVIAAGGVYSAASPSSTVLELARQITTGNSNTIICSSELKEVAIKAAKQCGVSLNRVLLLESWPWLSLTSIDGRVDLLSDEKLSWPRITDPQQLKESLIVILWSSGTTGPPKGVMLSHLNLVAESYLTALSGRAWVAKQLEADPNMTFPEYRALAHLPISHIAGLFGYCLAPLYAGGTVCWMRKYEWKLLLQYVKNFQITAFYTVPSIYLRIAKSPEVHDHFKHLVAATTGAAPMDADLQQAANARLGGDLTYIGQTYGLSETTGTITLMPSGEADVTGSISPLLPNVEVRIVDDDYNDVDPGERGEIIVRSPLVTNGYFRNEEATRNAFHDDWFCTGDIAVMRDSMFYIVDRKKELLKYKGLQIAPAEIENLLFTHPLIQEAAVIGIPVSDDPGSEVPRAYVVPVNNTPTDSNGSNDTSPAQITEDAVKDYVKARLAPYKQLRGGVVFVDELPKNAIGKYLRRELRDRAVKELGIRKQGARL